jgi:ABC-2 type transport system permease protein
MTLVSSAVRRHPLAEVWRYRGMLRALTARNLKVKYQGSALGFVWTLLNPLLMVGVLVAVFSHIVKIPLPHYWAFLLSGYFVWNFVQQSIGSASYIIAEHAALRRSVAFPSEVLVLGAVLARLIEFAAEMLLVLVALIALHHHAVPPSFALLPVLVLIQFLLVLGLVLPIASLAVFYHDVQHALPVALIILFYASPVFYPATMVPAAIRHLYLLNPVASLLTLYHTTLYEGRVPSLALLAASGLVSLALSLLGYAIFNRHKSVFAEIV